MTKRWTLVTGASGFLGSRLVRLLVERGESVKAFVRPGSNLRALTGYPSHRLQLAFGDIAVGHTVYRALAGCDRLYHVAANFRWWEPRASRVIDPATEGTRNVLEAARRRGNISRIVVTSSTAVLGVGDRPEPLDETHAFNLADAEQYALAKEKAHQIALEFYEDGLPLVLVMPSMMLGPGDWKPTPVGAQIVRYLNSKSRIPIMEGGANLVDVDDVAQGHVLAMERGRLGESYILGGDDVTYEQLYMMMSEATGLSLPGALRNTGLLELAGTFLELKCRLLGGDPPLTARMARSYAGKYAWVTSDKAKEELGYKHRSLTASLRRSVRWFLDHGYVQEPQSRRVRLELGAAGN